MQNYKNLRVLSLCAFFFSTRLILAQFQSPSPPLFPDSTNQVNVPVRADAMVREHGPKSLWSMSPYSMAVELLQNTIKQSSSIMTGYAVALQPPAGPVYVSIPLNDWDEPALGDALVRTVSTRYAPDPERLTQFAERIRESKHPVLIYGPEIERAGGWEAGIRFAEKLKAPVYMSPLTDRASFPQNHPQFRGMVPIAVGPLGKKLAEHDLVIVIGAQIFRYYPYIKGEYLPKGSELLQITSDPYDAAAAIVGDSLLSDARLALEALIDAFPGTTSRTVPSSSLAVKKTAPSKPGTPLTALEAFTALGEVRPTDAILVNETASNFADLLQNWPIVEPESYYTFASGGLGWGAPAAVGIGIAQKKSGTGRPVIAVIGDGSLQYSVQSLYTAARQKLKLIFVVPCNDEYAILKNFAVLENTPNVPALDLPGLDVVGTAKAFGCIGIAANTVEEIKEAFTAALQAEGPTVIAIRIAQQMRPLVPEAS